MPAATKQVTDVSDTQFGVSHFVLPTRISTPSAKLEPMGTPKFVPVRVRIEPPRVSSPAASFHVSREIGSKERESCSAVSRLLTGIVPHAKDTIALST